MQTLEARETPAIYSYGYENTTLVIKANNSPTNATFQTELGNYVLRDLGQGTTWRFSPWFVGSVRFEGGAANDRFVNSVPGIRFGAYGNGGNDWLEGSSGHDFFDGGPGNDTLLGNAGNDSLQGRDGNDSLRGGAGNDQIFGGLGDDLLNGGDGWDALAGGDGNDTLIALDSEADVVRGELGIDTLWVDARNAATDQVFADSLDKRQRVDQFANGADTTLDGDSIIDPTISSSLSYRRFANLPLFSSRGPQFDDIDQGGLGDCWMLAGLSAVAQDSPTTLRQNMVDFGDGTYGVHLGTKYYRVDADLPVYGATGTRPAFAKLARESSLWVAIAEKAYAHYRTGANSYASLSGGWGVEVNRAFGSTTSGTKSLQSFTSAETLGQEIYQRWSRQESVTIGFLYAKTGVTPTAPLVMSHMYSVVSVSRDAAGAVTSIMLRNPWGHDGVANNSNLSDGLVTVTPTQLTQYVGAINWGSLQNGRTLAR